MAAGAHTYTAAGVYTVRLDVADGHGGTAESFFRYVVVYDPSAGFVTGGGWIDSPEGALVGSTATGRAQFGFVSRYKPGTTIPDGNTQFLFKTGGLDFKSTSYDWLVVSGARAQYKGTGTVNGVAGYKFMLTAVDGQRSGGGGVDRFRIKIWNEAGVVYDNGLGAGDNVDGTYLTAIGGGSIQIHDNK